MRLVALVCEKTQSAMPSVRKNTNVFRIERTGDSTELFVWILRPCYLGMDSYQKAKDASHRLAIVNDGLILCYEA